MYFGPRATLYEPLRFKADVGTTEGHEPLGTLSCKQAAADIGVTGWIPSLGSCFIP